MRHTPLLVGGSRDPRWRRCPEAQGTLPRTARTTTANDRARRVGQPGSDVLLDFSPPTGWQGRQTLCNPCWAGRETGPVVLEIRVVKAEHNRHFQHFDEPDLMPEVCLAPGPHNRTRLNLRS